MGKTKRKPPWYLHPHWRGYALSNTVEQLVHTICCVAAASATAAMPYSCCLGLAGSMLLSWCRHFKLEAGACGANVPKSSLFVHGPMRSTGLCARNAAEGLGAAQMQICSARRVGTCAREACRHANADGNWLRESCLCVAEQAVKTRRGDRKPARHALPLGVCVIALDTSRSSLGKLTAVRLLLLGAVSIPPLRQYCCCSHCIESWNIQETDWKALSADSLLDSSAVAYTLHLRRA